MRVRLMAIVACLVIYGCSEVTTPHPMGEKAVALEGSEWEGTWVDDNGFVALMTVADRDEGTLKLAWIDVEEGEAVLKQSKGYVRRSCGWTFASVMKEGEDPLSPERYFWARIKKEDDVIVIWEPDALRFDDLVDQGVLPGKADDGNVQLGKLDAEHYAIITSDDRGVLFNWDEPYIMRRVQR